MGFILRQASAAHSAPEATCDARKRRVTRQHGLGVSEGLRDAPSARGRLLRQKEDSLTTKRLKYGGRPPRRARRPRLPDPRETEEPSPNMT